MTYRQALETALRECGASDADVPRVMAKCERLHHPGPPFDSEIGLHFPGKEWYVIERFKQFWLEAEQSRLNSKN